MGGEIRELIVLVRRGPPRGEPGGFPCFSRLQGVPGPNEKMRLKQTVLGGSCQLILLKKAQD